MFEWCFQQKMTTSEIPDLPPDRKFGLFIATVLAVLLWVGFGRGWSQLTLLMLASVSLLIAGFALLRPSALRPLNVAWLKLGLMLGCVVNPIILGVIYFGFLTPVAVIGRLLGRDELRLKHQGRASYWSVRTSSERNLESFRRQF